MPDVEQLQCLGFLHHVDLRQHVDVDISVDHQLALLTSGLTGSGGRRNHGLSTCRMTLRKPGREV